MPSTNADRSETKQASQIDGGLCAGNNRRGDGAIILKAKDADGLFEDGVDVESAIAQELPHLLQWLLEWEPPEEVTGQSRYGVTSYCDTSLRQSMEADNPDVLFLELLDTFLDEVKEEHEGEEVTFKTTELVTRMKECELIRSLMSAYKPTHVGHILSRFEARGYGLKYKRTSAGSQWTIQFNYRPKES